MSAMNHDQTAERIPFGLKLLLSGACCLILMNIYYAQPIIAGIAEDLGLDIAMSGLIVTVTQAGYCAAVLFLVPLGDVLENKRLVLILVVLAAGALAGAGFSSGPVAFFAASFCLGLASCAVQVIIPMGIGLVSSKERGSLAGMMMSGAILGIVISRPMAGRLTEAWGWRSVYLAAACLMAGLTLILARFLPTRQGTARRLSYADILRSMGSIFMRLRGLRPRLLIMFSIFFSFTMFWSTAPMYLRDAVGLSHSDVAIFSLLGLAGPLCALFAGKMVDRGLGFRVTVAGMSMLPAAFLMTLGWADYTILILPVMLLVDPGTHMTSVVVHQSVLNLTSEARSRVNALCIGFNITGGALGASTGPWLYSRYGWNSVALAGVLMIALAFSLNVYSRRSLVQSPA